MLLLLLVVVSSAAALIVALQPTWPGFIVFHTNLVCGDEARNSGHWFLRFSNTEYMGLDRHGVSSAVQGVLKLLSGE